MTTLHIIGGGLAGSEAAWQAAQAGVRVALHEMRPVRGTDAHVTDGLADPVIDGIAGNGREHQQADHPGKVQRAGRAKSAGDEQQGIAWQKRKHDQPGFGKHNTCQYSVNHGPIV